MNKIDMNREKVEMAIVDLLAALGEDAQRDGLRETPQRVARMYEELLSGTEEDPRKHLKFFTEDKLSSEIVVVKDIPVHSICEHHLLPFVGVAHVACLPKGNKIIGLSKFARIVDCFAKRLQVQERLTDQVAKFIYYNADMSGVIVLIEAEHLCMTMRGIKAAGSKTRTAAFYGVFKDDLQKRNEALNLIKQGW